AVVLAFLDRAYTPSRSSLHIRDGALYSYNTPMAYFDGEDIILNQNYYTPTTARQMSMVRRVLAENGYEQVPDACVPFQRKGGKATGLVTGDLWVKAGAKRGVA